MSFTIEEIAHVCHEAIRAYNIAKDRKAKTHPALLPWDQLPKVYKTKAELFVSVVNALS